VETIRLDSDLHRVVVGHDVDLTDGAHVVEREGARIGNGGVVVDGHLVPGGRDGDVPQCVVLGQADPLGQERQLAATQRRSLGEGDRRGTGDLADHHDLARGGVDRPG
jgi:acetyltransferase-like isoleucine patch superfamily enzyme